jgi:hypothetical protein
MKMTIFWKHAAGLAIAMALASSLSGCVIAADSRPLPAREAQAGGATYCQKSSDGFSVACGGNATFCEQSSDGRHVACGGLATFCQKSSSGEDVACGGKATYCDKSNDGRRVACGGGMRGG